MSKKYVVANSGQTYRCFTRKQFSIIASSAVIYNGAIDRWEEVESFDNLQACRDKCIEELEMQRLSALDEIEEAGQFPGKDWTCITCGSVLIGPTADCQCKSERRKVLEVAPD